jgi:hypothetical protein
VAPIASASIIKMAVLFILLGVLKSREDNQKTDTVNKAESLSN